MPIEKLDIKLKIATKEEYEAAKAEFIAEYKEYESGFFRGGFKLRPDIGRAKWDARYPKGYSDWVHFNGTTEDLSVQGQQRLIDKLNEVINHLNKEK